MNFLPRWYIPPHLRNKDRKPAVVVLKALGDEFGLSPGELRAKDKRRYEARARQIGWYVMSRHCKQMSLPMMARFFGRSDHTTALHGIRLIEQKITKGDQYIIETVERIEKAVRA